MQKMDSEARAALARIVTNERVAALATLRQGAPLASLVSFLPQPDFSGFVLRLSRLAWHTQDMEKDARVSLMIAERDDGRADPQTLARVTLRGEILRLPAGDAAFGQLKGAWLARFPEAAVTFELADFSFWRLAPRGARFVAGLGRTYNLSAADLQAACAA